MNAIALFVVLLIGAASSRLTVFNALGEEVATLEDGLKNAGYHERVFNAEDLGSGAYFYRMGATTAAGTIHRETRKMLLAK